MLTLVIVYNAVKDFRLNHFTDTPFCPFHFIDSSLCKCILFRLVLLIYARLNTKMCVGTFNMLIIIKAILFSALTTRNLFKIIIIIDRYKLISRLRRHGLRHHDLPSPELARAAVVHAGHVRRCRVGDVCAYVNCIVCTIHTLCDVYTYTRSMCIWHQWRGFMHM